jgi:aspartate-semialdehyde dehydrogenase
LRQDIERNAVREYLVVDAAPVHQFYCLPLQLLDAGLAGGAARGELQVAAALRRLLADPSLPVSVTRTCVPIFYGGALSVNVETSSKLTATDARDILRAAPGVLLRDDAGTLEYPTPIEAVGHDAALVGRIREDESLNVLDIWMAIDNLRKGAAVNAVQIAELLIRDYL